MRTLLLGTVVATGATAALIAAAPLANADPGNMPCTLSLSFLCSMLPAYPNLDHDIDVSQNPDALEGAAQNPSTLPDQPHG